MHSATVIPFPKPFRERIDVTYLLWQEVRQMVIDKGWREWRPELTDAGERCYIVRTA